MPKLPKLMDTLYNGQYALTLGIFFDNGGERGIRTLGAAFDSTHDFQSCSFGQLGHLS